MPYREHKTGLDDFLLTAARQLERKLPYALFRRPGDTKAKAVFQSDDRLHLLEDYEQSGFVFAPFDSRKPKVLLSPDLLLQTLIGGKGKREQKNHGGNPDPDNEAREKHMELVTAGKEEIRKGALLKVVLSRRIEYPLNPDPNQIFKILLEKYADAFCYLWYHPAVGTWLGATPETLLSLEKGRLTTMSLAGTQRVIAGQQPVWGTKEKEEQGIVTRYLEKILKPHTTGLRVAERNFVRAGNLWHLKSEITGNLKQNHLGSVIEAIHPTPAVCGIPLKAAQRFIRTTEGYEREFYSGYLGELNMNRKGDCELYVNLRCMKLEKGKAFIYVGGGITAASDPKAEWEETLMKSRTMLDLLPNS